MEASQAVIAVNDRTFFGDPRVDRVYLLRFVGKDQQFGAIWKLAQAQPVVVFEIDKVVFPSGGQKIPESKMDEIGLGKREGRFIQRFGNCGRLTKQIQNFIPILPKVGFRLKISKEHLWCVRLQNIGVEFEFPFFTKNLRPGWKIAKVFKGYGPQGGVRIEALHEAHIRRRAPRAARIVPGDPRISAAFSSNT